MSSQAAIHLPTAGPAHRIRPWQTATIPILAGPMRGTRWFPASGGKLVRIFTGKFESEQTAMFQRFVGAGDVVFDLGASVGYYTLLSARLVGSRGHVVAFEPCPKNAAFLREHVAANGYSNVDVHQAAVAEAAGVAYFAAGSGPVL